MRRRGTRLIGSSVLIASAIALCIAPASLNGQEGFKFKSGVELINVTATVTDRSGHYVPDLEQRDFVVYEDGQPVEITHFSAERVPVSLGIVLDGSGSMAGEKMLSARDAIRRFLGQLLSEDDEVFLYAFHSDVELVHDWTRDKESVSKSLRRVLPSGGTAMYDGVAEAVPMAQAGQNPKKAVVLISDGNDTDSRTDARDVRQLVRQTEVLVYAIGIDGAGEPTLRSRPPIIRQPTPFPFPGRRGGRPPTWPMPPQYPQGPGGTRGAIDDRVNGAALRAITDESGGRTEIVHDPRDLGPATTSIADELSRQYYIGYASPGHRDGRWHEIKVEAKDKALKVRARRGYTAAAS